MLYLAIAEDIHNEFFTNPFVRGQLIEYTIKLLIVDPSKQEIVAWKE